MDGAAQGTAGQPLAAHRCGPIGVGRACLYARLTIRTGAQMHPKTCLGAGGLSCACNYERKPGQAPGKAVGDIMKDRSGVVRGEAGTNGRHPRVCISRTFVYRFEIAAGDLIRWANMQRRGFLADIACPAGNQTYCEKRCGSCLALDGWASG